MFRLQIGRKLLFSSSAPFLTFFFPLEVFSPLLRYVLECGVHRPMTPPAKVFFLFFSLPPLHRHLLDGPSP